MLILIQWQPCAASAFVGLHLQVWNIVKGFEKGTAIFTQPASPVKCGGAPQKIMWMSEDLWRVQEVRDKITVVFATGMPTMFAVPKYSDILEVSCYFASPHFYIVIIIVSLRHRAT